MRIAVRTVLFLIAAIVGVLAGVLARSSMGSAAQAVDLELALAVDVSGSIDDTEAALQRNGYIAAFRDPAVIKAITGGMLRRVAVAYYEWAGFGHHRIIADWTVIHDAASANAFADALTKNPPRTAARTAIGDTINFAVPFFDRNDIEGTRRVVDVSGDGPNNWGAPVAAARDAAVAAGITINGLPIVNDRPSPFGWPQIPNLDLYYRDCVIGGPGAFYVVANGFKAFATAIRKKLILEIAGDMPEPKRIQVRIRRYEAKGGSKTRPYIYPRGRMPLTGNVGAGFKPALHRLPHALGIYPSTPPRLLRVQAPAPRAAPSCDIGRRRWRDLEDN